MSLAEATIRRALLSVPLLVLGAPACAELDCDTRSLQEISWDDAPEELGFSADDFAQAFAPTWGVRHFEGPERDDTFSYLRTMDQDWVWTWRPDRSEQVLHRELRDFAKARCGLHRRNRGLHTLTLPAHFEGWSSDGAWRYAGRGDLVTGAMPTAVSPIPAFWEARRIARPADGLQLTGAPPEFEREAAEHLELPNVPEIVLETTGSLQGFRLTMHVSTFYPIDNEEFRFRRVGETPRMALTKPIP